MILNQPHGHLSVWLWFSTYPLSLILQRQGLKRLIYMRVKRKINETEPVTGRGKQPFFKNYSNLTKVVVDCLSKLQMVSLLTKEGQHKPENYFKTDISNSITVARRKPGVLLTDAADRVRNRLLPNFFTAAVPVWMATICLSMWRLEVTKSSLNTQLLHADTSF
uniref:Uncharacterized protein n=1 Tax=Glossina pallidipes TaxID=7398 RepID=A0A1A9Z1U0_GLOPL